jgi:hypothetical protein
MKSENGKVAFGGFVIFLIIGFATDSWRYAFLYGLLSVAILKFELTR